MLKNHLKTVLRKLIKDKRYTLINVVGLSTGLMLFLVITLFVQRELNVDKHHVDSENIFRVNTAYTTRDGDIEVYASGYDPMAQALKQEIPEVIASANFFSPAAQLSFRSGDEIFSLEDKSMLYTSNDFFEVFTVDWNIEGTRLDEPNTAVISTALAMRFFGNENPIGKTLTYEDQNQQISLTVSGVFETSKNLMHFDYEMLINKESNINFWKGYLNNNWNLLFVYTYFKTTPGTDETLLNEKLVALKEKYQEDRQGIVYESQALSDIYWNPELFEPGVSGDMSYIYVFGSLAIVVLVLAGVNFVNLMTARSIRRSKEIGIRKIVGASQGSIVVQYLTEAIGLAAISMLVAGTTVERLLPMINSSFGLELSFNLFSNTLLLTVILLTPVVIGFLSGIYPALVLSSFKAVSILGGRGSVSFSNNSLRKGLLVFQFLISVCVISGVLIIQDQMNFIRNSGLGFSEDPVIVLPRVNNDSNFLIRQSVQGEPGIEGIASLSSIPGYREPRTRNIKENGAQGEGILTNGIWASKDYAEIIGLNFVQGRNFELTDQENTVILNARASEELGWTPDEAIGKNIVMTGRNGFDPATYRILGVVEDYHYQSMYDEIEPLFIKNNSKSRSGGDATIVKVSRINFEQTVASLERSWNDVEKMNAFDYYFLDDAMRDIYQKELKLANTVNYVATISVLMCFLGLFGLVSLTLESKKKEIGIRKVLGATERIIAQLLSSTYSKIIILSVIVGLPISYYLLDKWLAGFEYRVNYSFGLYASVGFGLLLLSIILVGGQSIFASRRNPIESLRED